MRVMWYSNAPWACSGYGGQTRLFTERMAQEGWEVFIHANWGLKGQPIQVGEKYTVLPGSNAGFSVDLIEHYHTKYQPDLHVILFDIWVIPPETLETISAVAYAPVDHDPMTPAQKKHLSHCKYHLGMSNFAMQQMIREGILPQYVPHAIDTEVYRPLNNRAELRRKFGLTQDQFVVSMVAANNTYPSRKGFPQALQAFAAFAQDRPEAVLYLHTNMEGEGGGINLANMKNHLGIPQDQVRSANQFWLRDGSYTDVVMNEIYNISDVLLAPSMGEGFGIPVIEAQAAGCPVIVSDFTAQSELCGKGGWKLPVDRFYTAYESFQGLPHPESIHDALEEAYVMPSYYREEARRFALWYDINTVWEQNMKPALEGFYESEQMLAETGVS